MENDNKTPDEIIRVLRNSCAGCNPTPCCELEALGPESADQLKSQQSRIAELEAQLAASQRRERHDENCAMLFYAMLNRRRMYGFTDKGEDKQMDAFDKWRGPEAGKESGE